MELKERPRETQLPAWNMLNELSEIHSQLNRHPASDADERNRLNFPIKSLTVIEMFLFISAADAAC